LGRDDVIDQMRRRLKHAPRTAGGGEAAALATEGQQPAVAALAAAQPRRAVGQDAPLGKGVEPVLDEARQLGTGAGLGVGHEVGPKIRFHALREHARLVFQKQLQG
jgi:hypothetical protein